MGWQGVDVNLLPTSELLCLLTVRSQVKFSSREPAAKNTFLLSLRTNALQAGSQCKVVAFGTTDILISNGRPDCSNQVSCKRGNGGVVASCSLIVVQFLANDGACQSVRNEPTTRTNEIWHRSRRPLSFLSVTLSSSMCSSDLVCSLNTA